MSMTHICIKIKCGKCNCEYCPQCHNGCPQCRFGAVIIVTSSDTKEIKEYFNN